MRAVGWSAPAFEAGAAGLLASEGSPPSLLLGPSPEPAEPADPSDELSVDRSDSEVRHSDVSVVSSESRFSDSEDHSDHAEDSDDVVSEVRVDDDDKVEGDRGMDSDGDDNEHSCTSLTLKPPSTSVSESFEVVET